MPIMIAPVFRELPVADVKRSVEFYKDVLSFDVSESSVTFGPAHVRDVDALHEELVRKGANVRGAPVSHPWGLRDFCVRDAEGNEITFAQTFE